MSTWKQYCSFYMFSKVFLSGLPEVSQWCYNKKVSLIKTKLSLVTGSKRFSHVILTSTWEIIFPKYTVSITVRFLGIEVTYLFWNCEPDKSFVFWPFSLKLLWAPIVDGAFIASFGRRKSWLIPVQFALAAVMLYLSST